MIEARQKAKTLPHVALSEHPDMALPDVLLEYQKEVNRAMQTSPVVFCEKSRRIGITWGIAADAVLTAAANKAAGGMDVFYIGFNLDMTKEFIDTCGSWAKAFSHAASEVEEFVFKERDANGDEKSIQAFRINFDSGFEIVALTSRPRSLRGRQGYVIIDEAAFHDDLKELMKAALALLIWGGKVLVISTHDGADNDFNEYIQKINEGRLKYGHIRIDFDDALRDGLYKRICFVKGKEWTQEGETEWRAEVVNFYGDGADEELFCVPRKSAGTYLPGVLVESRMIDAPVLRLRCDDDFVFKGEFERQRIVEEWCIENLLPLLETMDPKLQSFLGEDFGRSGHLTVLWPLQLLQRMVRHTPFVVELSNVPFTQQKQIVWYIIDRLPRFSGAAFDGRGNGSQLAEETMQKYGAGIIHIVMITVKWYLDAMPKYKAALEDAGMTVPNDADIKNDHRAATVVGGVPQVTDKETKGADGNKRHGDSLIAAVMAYWATLQDIVEYAYTSVSGGRKPNEMRPRYPTDDDFDDDDDSGSRRRVFGANKGAW